MTGRHHVRPLTYAPKIQPVLEGKCTQTIRPKRLINVGDLIMFHGWSGKPYRSKWSFRTPYWPVICAAPILIFDSGMMREGWPDALAWDRFDDIAALDGIVPATGEELGRVLLSMHKIPADGLEAQILRWDPTKPEGEGYV